MVEFDEAGWIIDKSTASSLLLFIVVLGGESVTNASVVTSTDSSVPCGNVGVVIGNQSGTCGTIVNMSGIRVVFSIDLIVVGDTVVVFISIEMSSVIEIVDVTSAATVDAGSDSPERAGEVDAGVGENDPLDSVELRSPAVLVAVLLEVISVKYVELSLLFEDVVTNSLGVVDREL